MFSTITLEQMAKYLAKQDKTSYVFHTTYGAFLITQN